MDIIPSRSFVNLRFPWFSCFRTNRLPQAEPPLPHDREGYQYVADFTSLELIFPEPAWIFPGG